MFPQPTRLTVLTKPRVCGSICSMSFIDDVIDFTLPRLRNEYGDFPFSHSFIAAMLDGVLKTYRARLIDAKLNPALNSASAPDIVKYICGYHYARTLRLDEKTRESLMFDERYRRELIYDVTDELFVLENINTSAVRIVNRHNPVYCKFNILLDFLIGIEIHNRNASDERQFKSVLKLFETAFLKLKGILTLITQGLEKEGVIVWRSLHELECVISVLCKYGKDVVTEFDAFDRFDRKREDMDEATAALFDEKTAAFGINVKNNNEVDHFANYGWLGAIPGLTLNKWNLNFRYLEELAGLADKYREYQVACDASHMNAKTMKWEKQRVLDFLVKRCFNSTLIIIDNYMPFLSRYNIPADKNAVGKMISDLRRMIDAFLPPIPPTEE